MTYYEYLDMYGEELADAGLEEEYTRSIRKIGTPADDRNLEKGVWFNEELYRVEKEFYISFLGR